LTYGLSDEERGILVNDDPLMEEYLNLYGWSNLEVYDFKSMLNQNPTESYKVAEIPGVGWTVEPDSAHSSIIAIINTPKTGTGELTNYASSNTKDTAVFRAHRSSAGLKAVSNHRLHFNDPSHQCLIMTSIREPSTWIKSLFMEKNKILCEDSSMTMEKFFEKYLEWLPKFNYRLSSQDNPIKGLLEEFGAPSLSYHFENFDRNGGYSVVLHPEEGPLQGCKLLFLRLEDANNWSNALSSHVYNEIIPYNPAIRNPSAPRQNRCSKDVNNFYDELLTYGLSDEERGILVNDDPLMEEYFELYGI